MRRYPIILLVGNYCRGRVPAQEADLGAELAGEQQPRLHRAHPQALLEDHRDELHRHSKLSAAVKAVIAGPQRSIANIARDVYRHPLEVLTFFGVQPESHVVEIIPGKAGYWTEILAPYLKDHDLKDHGRYTASGDAERDIAALKARIALSPELYGKMNLTEFAGGNQEVAPRGSADFVLTFRNIHNWMRGGTADGAFRAFYRALKPGGILGVEEHG